MPADSSASADQRGVAINGDVVQSPIITGDHNVLTITYLGASVSIPSAESVQAHRAALRCKLESEATQRWGGMGAYIHEEGARLPIDASPYQPGLSGQREDLLKRLIDADRLIVLGEPGSGKTVALQRFAWELCAPDSAAIIPVIIPLLFYAGTPLAEWVRSVLQNTGHLRLDDDRALTAFLSQPDSRCIFLFDGLNEVSPAHRDRLKDELVRWLSAQPRHPVIITSRAQNEVWRALRQQIGEALVIQPITDPQIADYLAAGLGAEKGRAVFKRLDERLRALAQRPLLLWLMKEAALANESLPGNRGELYKRFVARLLARDVDRDLDTQLSDDVKRAAAQCLAYNLHRRETLTCTRTEAVSILSGSMPPAGPAAEVLRALLRQGLLIGDEQLRFPHQTLQEYFVAEALREQANHKQAQMGVTRAWRDLREALRGRPDGLAALAADDWWAESLVQLAGLIDDPTWLAREVSRTNPWLAWWCIEEGREVAADVRVQIGNRSILQLRSADVVERRRAVRIVRLLGNDRKTEPLLEAAADDDGEIANLAIQTLIQMGESVKERTLALVQQSDPAKQRAGLRYVLSIALVGDSAGLQILSQWLDMPLVSVPAGPFLMGSDPAIDKLAFDNEGPQTEVTMNGYCLGRYPVTVAQFRSFVTAGGYKPQNQNSLNGQDNQPVAYVSWDDAQAYCRWLGERSGLRVMLPSEAGWEKAARGTDARLFPWGNEPPDDSHCNFNNNVRGTTSVGQYSPRGDSPYGCADMAGNVWEWTRSEFKPYPYDPADGREDLQPAAHRVLRGGAFNFDEGSMRCAYRFNLSPDLRLDYLGFRIVVVPF